MNKHEAVWQWLFTCPYIQDMFFAFGLVENGATQLVPSEAELNEYIDGSKRMKYTASLVRYITLSEEPNDILNITNLVDFEQVKDWVDVRNESGEFPEFPDDCIVEELKVLPNTAGFAVDKDMTTAKYMIEFEIYYIQKR